MSERVKIADSAANRCLEGWLSIDHLTKMASGIAGYPNMGEGLSIEFNSNPHATTIRKGHDCILASRILMHQIGWKVRDPAQSNSIPCDNCLHAEAVRAAQASYNIQ